MSSNAFRSHLMQQFAATARSQGRAPLWHTTTTTVTPKTSGQKYESTLDESRVVTEDSNSPRSILQTKLAAKNDFGNRLNSTSNCQSERKLSSLISQHHFGQPDINCSKLNRLEKVDDDENEKNDTSKNTLSEELQNLIRSRRTISNFVEISKSPEPSQKDILNAITRAIECGMNAPNHHRTEPFHFTRIMAGTEASEQLTDIAFNVALQKNLTSKSFDEATKSAKNKQNKWKQTIRGYVVLTVSDQPCQDAQEVDSSIESESFSWQFERLQFQAPVTERQLEDYASGCAAIQNMLLSLHSEGFGAKWATGPVIRCRAFRKLIGCQSNDLVVGLVMVGTPKRNPKPWRKRKTLEDIVCDL